MSEAPEHDPLDPEESGAPADVLSSDPEPMEAWQPETWPLLSPLAVLENTFPAAEDEETLSEPPSTEPLLFQSWYQPEIHPPTRIPHLGHILILALLILFGAAGSMSLTWSALHFHLFGVSTIKQAETDIHYTLGSQAILYLLTFAPCLLIFPLFWRKGFFAGLQWNAATAFRLRGRLIGAACVCILLSIVAEALLPGPSDTPIDKLFRTPLSAWLLFAFGVTFAPFFEEIVFRGFLLPTLCTAWDWLTERATGEPIRPLDANGHPHWSIFAMAVASLFTSIPFALIHAEQTGWSLGPFLLLVCVSLVLCWVRLSTRSLAASVLVHACYNFMLFFMMLVVTGGFRHLDKM